MAYALEAAISVGFGKMTASAAIAGFITGGVGPGSYYYPLMLQFVFVFPVVYSIVKKHDFIGVVECFLLNGLYEVIQRSYGMGEATYRLLIFRYIFLIGAGCYMHTGKKKPARWVGVGSMLLGAGWLAGCCYLGYQPRVIVYWSSTSLLAALWVIPIVWLLLKDPKLSRMRCKPLEEMGRASYNIFLAQMVFFAYAASSVYKMIPNRAMQLPVCIFVSVTAGYLFYLAESRLTNRIGRICKEHDYWAAALRRALETIETVMTR
jgi:peptidoglycan/LPS O-acetylase OafA/YrhL